MKTNKCTISRIGKTDDEYIKALEDANSVQFAELRRLRKLVIKNRYDKGNTKSVRNPVPQG